MSSLLGTTAQGLNIASGLTSDDEWQRAKAGLSGLAWANKILKGSQTVASLVPYIGLGLSGFEMAQEGPTPSNTTGLASSTAGLLASVAGAPMGVAITPALPLLAGSIIKGTKGSKYVHINEMQIQQARKMSDGSYLLVAKVPQHDPSRYGVNTYVLRYDPNSNKLQIATNLAREVKGHPFEASFDDKGNLELQAKWQDTDPWGSTPVSGSILKKISPEGLKFSDFNWKVGPNEIINPGHLQAQIYNELVKGGDIQGDLLKPENFILKEHSVKGQNFDRDKLFNYQGDITETVPYQPEQTVRQVGADINTQPLPPAETPNIAAWGPAPTQMQTTETQGIQAPSPSIATTAPQTQQAAPITILTPTTGGSQQVSTNNSLLDPREAIKDTSGTNNLPDVLPRNTMQVALVDPRTPEGKKLQELFMGRLQGTLNTIEQQGLTQPVSPLRVGDRILVPKGEVNYRSSQIANLLKPLNQLTLAASRVPWRYDTMALNQGLMYPSIEHQMQSDLSQQQFQQQQALQQPSDTQQIGQWLGIGGQALSIASGINDLFGGNNNQNSLFGTVNYPITFGDTGLYGEDVLNQMSYDNTWQLNNWGW